MLDKYIRENWINTVRRTPEDDGTMIGLPFEYTVPSIQDMFQELYYWDTYFTNIGLSIHGHWDLCKANAENMFYLIDKYGFMPNGNRTFFLSRSQPPYLSEMVLDIYNHDKDKKWLSRAYEALKKEYDYWDKNRNTPIGLSQYRGTMDEETEEECYKSILWRIGVEIDTPKKDLAAHALCCAESGWDYSPRWGFEGYNFVMVDLNSMLFGIESNMKYFAVELGFCGEADEWETKRSKRKLLMNKYMVKNGLFYDYNFETKKLSAVFSAASVYPLVYGAATEEQAEAFADALPRLENENGIYACEKNDTEGTYQWDYPNGWAPLICMTIKGLLRYGYTDEAKQIAKKYVNLVEKVYKKTGNIWEKYDLNKCEAGDGTEYKTPTMMGWSAGVYLYAKSVSEN